MRAASLLLISLIWPRICLADPICDALETGDASLGTGIATCQTSLVQSGGEQMSCWWAFDYRSAEARIRLDDIRAGIETCLEGQGALPGDAQVNHPDSFELHRYEGPTMRAAVSLKDKAGLGQSLVFLSLTPKP